MSIHCCLTEVNARFYDNIVGVSKFVSIKVGKMVMKKVNCQFVCHFKENVIACGIFSVISCRK